MGVVLLQEHHIGTASEIEGFLCLSGVEAVAGNDPHERTRGWPHSILIEQIERHRETGNTGSEQFKGGPVPRIQHGVVQSIPVQIITGLRHVQALPINHLDIGDLDGWCIGRSGRFSQLG